MASGPGAAVSRAVPAGWPGSVGASNGRSSEGDLSVIHSVRGPVLEIGLDHAVVEVGGVGLAVYATPATLGGLRRGDEARLPTTLVVREDSLTLYGFADAEERELFLLLQTVSGIGTRLALATIAVLEPDTLRRALADGDLAVLTRIPGVGRKSAERLVVELRDKATARAAVPATVASTCGSTMGEQACRRGSTRPITRDQGPGQPLHLHRLPQRDHARRLSGTAQAGARATRCASPPPSPWARTSRSANAAVSSRRRPERPARVADLGQHRHRQQPARGECRGHRRVERRVAEPLADDDVVAALLDREPGVEVGLHPAHPPGWLLAGHELGARRQRGRGHVDGDDVEPPPGQPHRHRAAPAGQVQCPARGREQVEAPAQRVRRERRPGPRGGVPGVPAFPVRGRHRGLSPPGRSRRRR